MQWVLVNENGEVVNVLVYDGISPYIPSEGLLLKEVPDEIKIGDNINEPTLSLG